MATIFPPKLVRSLSPQRIPTLVAHITKDYKRESTAHGRSQILFDAFLHGDGVLVGVFAKLDPHTLPLEWINQYEFWSQTGRLQTPCAGVFP